jgi:hypothetical protein
MRSKIKMNILKHTVMNDTGEVLSPTLRTKVTKGGIGGSMMA